VAKDLDEAADQKLMDALFKRLKTDANVVRCGTTYVDVAGTIERLVACADGLCMRRRRGKRLLGKTCCSTFRVPLTTEDVEQVAKCVDEVRTLHDVDRAITKTEGWWFHDDEGLWLERRKNGSCVFFTAPDGEPPRCAIHEWALREGLEHRKYKPEGCCLFPIYLIEYGEEALITSYGTPYMLEVDEEEPEDIHTFKCTNPPTVMGTPLLIEQQDELAYRLGRARWGRMLAKLRKLGHAV